MLAHIEVKKNLLADEKYQYLFSVEEVNKLVLQGMPFRDAYKAVGQQIEAGQFHPDGRVQHSHAGSIGNLCTAEISKAMDQVLQKFQFDKAKIALERLLS